MSRFRPLPRSFFRRDAETVARDLLGRYLVRDTAAGRLALRLVEVEAYLGGDDPASHAFRGLTARNASMFLDGGHAYVYFIYGIHHCMNVVCGRAGLPHAVLLRAGEATVGEREMAARRGLEAGATPRRLAGGPGRLCAALGVDRALDGVSLIAGELRLARGAPVADAEVARGPRIGVDYAGAAAGWPLRFGIATSSALSRPFTAGSGRRTGR
jgi:DNA-3-methyladenine glycosylase